MIELNTEKLIVTGQVGGTFPWDTVSAVGPHLIWAALITGLLVLLGRKRIHSMIDRIEKVNVGGIELDIRRELAEASEERSQNTSPKDISRIARRLAKSTDLTQGTLILWIDDNPRNNEHETRILEAAGVRIDVALSSSSAFQDFDLSQYDLILSDMTRQGDVRAGINFAEALANSECKTPLIFYTGNALKPAPERAFGIADRPDELIHLILDVLARNKG